eukprot:m.1641820 g.1641820  ORF g.1641820 m.1641820 type:complete len:50 (-) comp49890_c0_seq1:177-326(-)
MHRHYNISQCDHALGAQSEQIENVFLLTTCMCMLQLFLASKAHMEVLPR